MGFVVDEWSDARRRLRSLPAYRRAVLAYRLSALALILMGLAVVAGLIGVRGGALMFASGSAFVLMLAAVILNWTAAVPIMRSHQHIFGPNVPALDRARVIRTTIIKDSFSLPRSDS